MRPRAKRAIVRSLAANRVLQCGRIHACLRGALARDVEPDARDASNPFIEPSRGPRAG